MEYKSIFNEVQNRYPLYRISITLDADISD